MHSSYVSTPVQDSPTRVLPAGSVAGSVSDRPTSQDPRRVHVPAPDGVAAPVGSGAPARSTVAPPRPAPPPRRPAPAAPTPPGRGPAPAPQTKTKPARQQRSRRRRLLRLAAICLPLVLLGVLIGGYLYANSIFNRIEKVEVGDVLAGGGSGTNYLIVGSDSRELTALEEAGLNPEAFQEGGGTRSDTVMVLHFGDDGTKMMSVPRDLYVPIAGTGESHKINAAYNGGPERLIRTVQESLGIPLDHYIEVDFVSFSKVVDAIGGVTIDFPHPATDAQSGLNVTESGPVELDGPQALAYARSRQYTENIDGQQVTDLSADIGRVERQQTFLRALFSELGASRNPLSLARAADGATDGLRIDDDMSLIDAMRFAWRLRSLEPDSLVLPTENGRNSSGSVLFLVEPDAQAVLDQVR
jgi:LCP family protein required for cell wall assembly